jgi:hypothetical protein
MDGTYEICENRKGEWENMTDVSKEFAELDKVRTEGANYAPALVAVELHNTNTLQTLGSEFGISAHIAHQSITKPMARLFYPDVDTTRECVVTQAYLTLPSSGITNILQANEICSREYMDYYDCEGKLAFFNIIDPASLQITEEKIQRFRRAMRFLGLAPSLIKAQIASIDQGHANPILPKHKAVVESKRYDHTGLGPFRDDVRKRLLGMFVPSFW